ncbi:MAG: sodium-dependent transporter [Lachnospiraceae bacterium]|nr:sodium-dependent transporter [Lachnospiraceae bacterium]
MNNNRERLGSRLGFILLSAGCAIGCGNVWKFPYLTGQNGGGAFVLLYIIFLIILGIPVMTMEFSIGRGSQKSPLKMLTTLQGKKQHWGWSSPLPFIGNVVLMMFYTCVAGWFLKYFVGFVSGEYAGLSAEQSGEAFGAMISNPGQQILFTAIICVIGFLICSFSLNKGLEQVTKYMMLILFLLLIVLVIHSCTLSGAKEGLTFYLLPDFTKITWGTVNAAMNQAFFTLSLGIGSMAIFGSYLDKKRSLMGESINVIILDTIVAIMAGLIIFPACSTFGVDAGAGPSLIFVTLPNIFANMAGGRIWDFLFFLFMTFAALSTVLAVFENILAMFRDWTGVSRVKGCIICGICMIILSIPCILGFNVWSGFVPFAEGSGVLDLEDFIVSNLLLPIGCFIYVLFCTWKFGWGWDNFTAEVNAGKGLKVKKWMKPYMQFILPIIILVVFIAGLLTFSFK